MNKKMLSQKYTIENIEKDKQYQKFLSKYPDLRKSIKTLYNWSMRVYCNFIGLNPTEIIQEARKDQETLPYVSDRRIDDHFTGYYQYLKNDVLIRKELDKRDTTSLNE